MTNSSEKKGNDTMTVTVFGGHPFRAENDPNTDLV